jgi:hypothetical protein
VTATRSLLSSIFAIHSRNSRREKFAGQLSSIELVRGSA